MTGVPGITPVTIDRPSTPGAFSLPAPHPLEFAFHREPRGHGWPEFMNETEKRYAFDRCGAYPLPGNRMLVRNPRNGRHAVLTPDVYGVLLGCGQFRTLRDHAAHIARSDPALRDQEEAVLSVLESVRKDGLMISADVYAVTLQPSATPHVNVDKPVAAVITWERPEALERCLASVRERVDESNLARFVVVDDSRSEEARQRNRAATEAFAEGAGAPVLYFGAEEQKGFMEAIIRQVPSVEEQVRFLIDRERWADHWTSGLARTLALLLSVGQRLLVLDDDILCEVFESEREAGVRFGDDAREARFYADEGEWEERRAERGTDPFVRHLRYLGSKLDDALGAMGVKTLGPESFDGAERDVLERWKGDSRVLVTECGSLGDPGTATLNWLVTLNDKSLAPLREDPDAVERALGQRNCWLGTHRPTLTPRANMSQLTGVDNRGLMPAYIPILRGEDRLFGNMVEFMHPESVVVDQPWAIAHRPIPPRTWSEAERRFDTRYTFSRFALEWIEAHRDLPRAEEPLKRLGQLARLYEDLADLPPADIVRAFEDAKLTSKTRDYRDLRAALVASSEAPEAWRTFLEEALDRLNRELIDNPADPVVRGDPKHLEGNELVAWWREFWRAFARALRAWPAIRLAARRVQI